MIALLLSKQVVKVGRSVLADLRRLADKWSLDQLREQLAEKNPEHIVELGVLAKMKGLVSNAWVSLSALTGIVLHHALQKTEGIQSKYLMVM